jgi:NAD+ synthase (glutamine-hydrolysing)
VTVLRVAIAQLPNVVGDIHGNAERISETMDWAEDERADVLVLPELVLTGYPLSDLALHQEFVADAGDVLLQLAERAGDTVTVLSTVDRVPPRQTWDSRPRDVTIAAALLSGGEVRGMYHKVLLPTHGGYDEGRVFAAGREPDAIWRLGDVIAGVSICEDLWTSDGPPEAQSVAGARVILAPNASPWWRGKAGSRARNLAQLARRNGVPIVYANLVGGQDELVFDGGSLIADRHGELVYRAPDFTTHRAVVDLELPPPRPLRRDAKTVHTRPVQREEVERTAAVAEPSDEIASVWQALVMGTRDFATRNGYNEAIIALSGGIDAVVTAAVAAEALGAENVLGIAMPGAETPHEELGDAEQVASNLGITFAAMDVTDVVETLTRTVDGRSGVTPTGDARVALEARGRSAVLLTIADEEERLALATGNKTELSVGSGTLHGDIVGGFAPLRDCPKTLLYELARYRNRQGQVIPDHIFDKPTTAQQLGDGWPPPYEVLDRIVERYVEHGAGLEDLIADGFEPNLALEVVRRIDDAELLRRLVPPGVKVTARAFTHDRRLPISNAWRPHRHPDAVPSPEGPRPWEEVEVPG